jgi:hypothetical protein
METENRKRQVLLQQMLSERQNKAVHEATKLRALQVRQQPAWLMGKGCIGRTEWPSLRCLCVVVVYGPAINSRQCARSCRRSSGRLSATLVSTLPFSEKRWASFRRPRPFRCPVALSYMPHNFDIFLCLCR